MLNKILYSSNGVLSDLTPVLQDYYNGVQAFTFNAAQDKIYIGSKFPFTRKYLKASGANTTITAATAIRYWDGSNWRSAAEVIDGTSASGKPLANSGYLSFTLDKQYAWARDDTVVGSNAKITGLSTVKIYDMYWLELTYSANVPATLAWFGDILCTDADLASEHPDLSRSAVMTAFSAGKTTWEEQRIAAGQVIAADLKRFVAASPNLMLSVEQLCRPCVSKTAEIVFGALEGFQDGAKRASLEYAKRMDPKMFDVDRNQDGQDQPDERQTLVSRMRR